MKMNVVTPIQADNITGCPFPFFDDKPKTYKIYNDGRHFIATECLRGSNCRKPQDLSNKQSNMDNYTQEQQDIIYRRVMRDKRKAFKNRTYKTAAEKIDISRSVNGRTPRSAFDILFDSLFTQAYDKGLHDRKVQKPMSDYIKSGLLQLFSESEISKENITERIKRKINNLHHRKKRFRRKAYLNEWNYFVTFTYDDKKHNEETFKKKIRRCLSNLHTRRNWRYMGVFERAPETGRLHFHGLVYVPVGEMLGVLEEKTDYSTAQGQMQTRRENSFFAENYGRNDFEEISKMELEYGKNVDYILKYIGKTNERIVYSRGIPTEICLKLTASDIVTELQNDFVQKYILFDDVVNWERDIARFRFNYQMTIIDLLCNPPSAA